MEIYEYSPFNTYKYAVLITQNFSLCYRKYSSLWQWDVDAYQTNDIKTEWMLYQTPVLYSKPDAEHHASNPEV